MGSLGAWLRAQREARGVSLAEIADASKISLRHLEALERDRFDALPAPVFVRGFLREYGRIVGLDVDEVVNVYLLAAEAARPAQEPRREGAAQAASRRRPRALAQGLVAAGLIAVVLGAAAGVAYWLNRPKPAPSPAAAGEVAADAPAAALRAPAEAPVPAEPAPPAAPWLAEPTVAEPEASPGTPAAMRVVLEFQQDCWVEVVVDGRRRESELKAGGETWAIEAGDSVVLTLGNAPAVRVEVDGRPVELPLDGRVVRDFRIDRRTGNSGRQPELSGT
jgi:cytoskeleton protein RodZ